MVEITWRCSEKLNILEMSGHAAFAPYGSDIVCAALSALTFALSSFLEDRLELTDAPTILPGEVLIKANAGDISSAAFEMAFLGFRLIEEKFPKYVCCKYVWEG